jgi:4'-phosphopantetheinyl transferase
MSIRHWQANSGGVVLTEKSVAVWRVSLDPGGALLEKLKAHLSADEHERAGRFYFENLRRRFVVARGALRVLLGQFSDSPPGNIDFDYAQHGKPYLAGSRLRFNLSHAHELALIAVALDREVGVDIEHVRPLEDAEAIARRFFSSAEVEQYLALPEMEQPRAFFNCWTRKEAYIKAIGDGLTFPLDQFEVSLAPGEAAILRAVYPQPEEVQRWKLADLEPGEAYIGAVIAEGQEWELRLYEFDFEIT